MKYWITETYLKVNTPLTKNIDANEILPNVKSNSDLHIKSILGSYFYIILLGKYNSQTLNSDETTLVEYIQPIVAWRAAADCVFDLTYQLRNKGLQTQNGDNSESVDFNEVVFGMKHYNQKAEWYTNQLTSYLNDNKSLFPDFISTANKDSVIKPKDVDSFGTDMLMI